MELKNKWRDIESGEIITESQLRKEWKAAMESGECDPVTFEQYIENCMTYNNGTLENIVKAGSAYEVEIIYTTKTVKLTFDSFPKALAKYQRIRIGKAHIVNLYAVRTWEYRGRAFIKNGPAIEHKSDLPTI